MIFWSRTCYGVRNFKKSSNMAKILKTNEKQIHTQITLKPISRVDSGYLGPSLILIVNCIFSLSNLPKIYNDAMEKSKAFLRCILARRNELFFKKSTIPIGIQPRCYNHITLELCKMVTYGQLQRCNIQWTRI